MFKCTCGLCVRVEVLVLLLDVYVKYIELFSLGETNLLGAADLHCSGIRHF